MLIHIMYPGNIYDYVREFMLGNLIESGKIVKFRRSGGWVTIGNDLVRSEEPHQPYKGIEKRGTAQPFSLPGNGMFQTEPLHKRHI